MINSPRKVCLVFGTRPEAIKLAPIIQQWSLYAPDIKLIICSTNQHREMLQSVLPLFEINLDYQLDIMETAQSLEHITTAVMTKLSVVLGREKPDYMIVQGDTASAFAAALTGFYHGIPVAHVEAGLRTNNPLNPFPEEMNRRLIDTLSSLHFAPTAGARHNLLEMGISEGSIEVSGNTVVDALKFIRNKSYPRLSATGCLNQIPFNQHQVVMVTVHRRELTEEHLLSICNAVKYLAVQYAERLTFLWPVHLNPAIHRVVHQAMAGISNVILTEPLPYDVFIQAMARCRLILTDSGGIQEEAPSLGVPVFILRSSTERPEVIDAHEARLIGTKTEDIISAVEEKLLHPNRPPMTVEKNNPFGDARAAERIIKRMVKEMHQSSQLIVEKKDLSAFPQ